MSSPVNAVVIQVTDGIAPSIAPNLTEISKQARSAQNSLQSLKAALVALDQSGVSGLRQTLRDVSSSTTLLSNSTLKMGQAASSSASQINQLAASYHNLNFAIQASITTLNSFSAASGTASASSVGFKNATTSAAAGTASLGSGAMQATATLKVLEGSSMGATRAAGAFLATTLGLGRVLAVAFPVIGILALLEVFSQLVTSLNKVRDAYNEMDAANNKATFDAILNGEKLVRAKPEAGFFSVEGLAKLAHNDRQAFPEIVEITNVQTKLKELQDQRRLMAAESKRDEAGLTGIALNKQRQIDIQKEIDLLKSQEATVKNLTEQLYLLGTASHQNISFFNQGGFDTETGLQLPAQVTGETRDLSKNQIAAVGAELKTAKDAARELDVNIKVLGFDLQAVGNKSGIAQAKDDAKAATAQMKLFKQEMANLKTQDGIATPQQRLELLTQESQRALPANQGQIATEIATTTQEIAKQNLALSALSEKYHDQVTSIGLYSDAQKIKHVQDKIDEQLVKEGIAVNGAKALQAKRDAATSVTAAEYEKQLNSIYTQIVGPLKNYEAGLQAVNKLEADGAITHNEALRVQNELTKSYRDATVPLFEYAHGLENEIALFDKYGTALTVATAVQQVQEQLRARGLSLTSDETRGLTDKLTNLAKERAIQGDLNKLYGSTIEAKQRLVQQEIALSRAKQQGIITLQREQTELAKLKVAEADLAIEQGKLTRGNVLTSIFGNYIKQFEGFTKETTKLYQGMFATIADGAANSLGRAIAYGEDLGQALTDVARQAVSELITGFIKLGIQWLITQALGQGLATAAVAASSAQAAALAAAWAAPAMEADIATLGGASAAADIAYGTSIGLAQALAAGTHIFQMNGGGLVPGMGSTDTVPSMLTPGEWVLTKSQVQQIGVPTLQAMRNNPQNNTVSKGGMIVNVTHDGTTNVQVKRISETEVRIIARQEADNSVTAKAPAIIAGHIQNPNSPVSKAIARNTDARRRR